MQLFITAWTWLEGHLFIWLVAGMVLCMIVVVLASRDD